MSQSFESFRKDSHKSLTGDIN